MCVCVHTCVFIYMWGWRGVCAQHMRIRICIVWDAEGVCTCVFIYVGVERGVCTAHVYSLA